MDRQNAAPHAIDGKGAAKLPRRFSFTPIRSPMRALRTLSISSQISTVSEPELSSPQSERRTSNTLRKLKTSVVGVKEELARRPSKASSGSRTARTLSSTRPTTPSITGSHGTTASEDFGTVVKFGPLQGEPSILKPKKEFLVLTPSNLLKFKNRQAAIERFPQIAGAPNTSEPFSPVESIVSLRDLGGPADVTIPLERVVAAFREEGTKPSFGIEIWWKDSNLESAFTSSELNFTLPEDRDDWLKQIRYAIKHRVKALLDERTPSEIEADFVQILQAKYPDQKDSRLDIYPVVPRRPYTRLRTSSGDTKKGWRDGSSFYLALSKTFCFLAQFSRSSNGQRTIPNLVQFGLVTLSRVNARTLDERFDLIFRLPLDEPKRLELSSIYHHDIIARLYKADSYLKPAWPLWTKQETFFVEDDTHHLPLPEGEDTGGFQRTLGAFLDGYHCASVNWKVNWRGVKYAPEFRLLPSVKRKPYTVNQLIAVFRALRFNDYFKSLSFRGVDFSPLAELVDNEYRLEPTIWLSRTGRHSLTRDEFEILESSSVLTQELVAMLLGSEAVKHIDLTDVLGGISAGRPATSPSYSSSGGGVADVMLAITLLLNSGQTRCRSVVLDGNPFGPNEIAELAQTLQDHPGKMVCISLSRCSLDDNSIATLWLGIHDQSSSLEVLRLAHNHGRIEASKASHTLRDMYRMRQLDLTNCLKGSLDEPLFLPWITSPQDDAFKLEDLNLSGWKINFETISGLTRYLETPESGSLRQLKLNNCGITGDVATALFCSVGPGRTTHIHLSGNPLEEGSTDWIDLIEGNETPAMLHLDMIQFKHEPNFHRLLKALAQNFRIEYLSLAGTGSTFQSTTKASALLSAFLTTNSTMKYLDLSGYSGRLEDSHMGWMLSGALSGLKKNTSLRQLRLRNHDIGGTDDVSELCSVLAANTGLAMLDIQSNNFTKNQFVQIVDALATNHRIISFPLADSDRDFAVDEERRVFLRHLGPPMKGSQRIISKSEEVRMGNLLSSIRDQMDLHARRVRDILERNQNNPVNHALHLEAEYLESWEDDDLPAWLTLKPRPPPGPEGRPVYSRNDSRRSGSFIVPPTSKSPNVGIGFMKGHKYSASDSALKTFKINEEGSASDYTESLGDDSPGSDLTPAADERIGSPSSQLSSSVEYEQMMKTLEGQSWQ